MGNISRNFFSYRTYRKMTSITISSICILCSIPTDGICHSADDSEKAKKRVSKILHQVEKQNTESTLEEFDKLDVLFEESKDPIDEGLQFLQTFITEINAKYGLNLTIQDACVLVKENIHTLNMPEALQTVVLSTIELYEINSTSRELKEVELNKNIVIAQNIGMGSWSPIYLTPMGWLFYLAEKKHKRKKAHHHKHQHSSDLLASQMIGPFPDDLFIGGCELLIGALISLLPISGARIVGVGMMGDGARRIFDGVNQMGKKQA